MMIEVRRLALLCSIRSSPRRSASFEHRQWHLLPVWPDNSQIGIVSVIQLFTLENQTTPLCSQYLTSLLESVWKETSRLGKKLGGSPEEAAA
jgi:hypothetical protein